MLFFTSVVHLVETIIYNTTTNNSTISLALYRNPKWYYKNIALWTTVGVYGVMFIWEFIIKRFFLIPIYYFCCGGRQYLHNSPYASQYSRDSFKLCGGYTHPQHQMDVLKCIEWCNQHLNEIQSKY
eukprot:UN01850